jgi:hypothetical protein
MDDVEDCLERHWVEVQRHLVYMEKLQRMMALAS